MAEHNEMTRYAFISHIEDYLKKLLSDPLKADTDDFLKSHGLDGPSTIKLLLARANPDDENSAIVIRSERIVDNGADEDGKRIPDSFKIKYKVPRKDYTKKMRNLYISLFESNIIDKCPIVECDGGGACSCGDAGGGATSTFGMTPQGNALGDVTPLFGTTTKKKKKSKTDENSDVIKRTLYITQEQAEAIKKVINEDCPAETNTAFGDFGYDAPMGDGKKNKKNKFFAAANDHKDMMAKSWPNK